MTHLFHFKALRVPMAEEIITIPVVQGATVTFSAHRHRSIQEDPPAFETVSSLVDPKSQSNQLPER